MLWFIGVCGGKSLKDFTLLYMADSELKNRMIKFINKLRRGEKA